MHLTLISGPLGTIKPIADALHVSNGARGGYTVHVKWPRDVGLVFEHVHTVLDRPVVVLIDQDDTHIGLTDVIEDLKRDFDLTFVMCSEVPQKPETVASPEGFVVSSP